MLPSATVLLFPWLVALAVTPLVIRWGTAHGYIDRPGARKIHDRPTAAIGGPAVFGSAAIGLALAAAFYPPIRELLWGQGSLAVLGAGIACMAGLGMIDDKHDLSAPAKAVLQIGIAAGTWLLGFRVGYVELPMGWEIVDAALPSLVLTVAWIVLVSNAFNLIDGIDGLASGVGLIVALTLFVLAADLREAVPAMGALAMAGALAGFLRYNVPPARIFLGDSGALAVGYTAAVVSIGSYQKSSTAMVIAIPLLAMALPLLDVLLAVLRRGQAHLRERGLHGLTPRAVVRAVFQADRGHIHYLLLRSGWSVRRILFALYAVCGAFAVMALAMRSAGSTTRWAVAAVTVLAGLAVLRMLERRVERLERSSVAEAAGPQAPRRAAG